MANEVFEKEKSLLIKVILESAKSTFEEEQQALDFCRSEMSKVEGKGKQAQEGILKRLREIVKDINNKPWRKHA